MNRIEWSPIVAGTILACALSLVLLQFGQALGLSFNHLATMKTITLQTVLVFGLWTLWIQLSASIVGAYMAGRSLTAWDAGHESELRDGAHGLLVWALSTLVVALAVAGAAYFASFAHAHGAAPDTTLSEEMQKKVTIISGFSLAAISLVSAATAWVVATIAGDHRDRRVDARKHYTFRRVA